MTNTFDWVDSREEEIKKERAEGYFDIVEGNQQFVLLSHCAPLAQVYDKASNKYRLAEEGDRNASIKGLCWVLQDGLIKQAKLPYTIVKALRALQQNPDWEFAIPFEHTLTLNAVGAGTKEVKYSLTPSPKKTPIAPSVMEELKKKPSPDELIEKMRSGKVETSSKPEAGPDINPEDVPF